MKHFFFIYDDSFDLASSLEEYVNQESASKDDKVLKVYYDVTDIIYDKRFEQNDKLIEVLVNETKKDDTDSGKKKPDSKKAEHFRLRGLKTLWDIVERQYKLFTMDNKEMLYNKSIDNEYADQQYEISMMLVLYHLVRDNLCLRISLCYYENFDLDASDSWALKELRFSGMGRIWLLH